MPVEPPGPPETLRFEEALTALEQIVEALESGQLSLEEAVDLFEKGVLLAKACGDRLAAVKLRVTRIEDLLGVPSADEP